MDILDAALAQLIDDDYNHVPADELRARLAALRGTNLENDLWESADRFVAELREALRHAAVAPADDELEYGPR